MENKYKTYRYIKNVASLNKFDLGTPDSSGRQLNSSLFVLAPTVEKQMDLIPGISDKEILSGVIPNIQQSLNPILSSLGTVTSNARLAGIEAAANVGKNAGKQLVFGSGVADLAQASSDLTQEAAVLAGKQAAKEAVKKGLTSKVLGAAGNVAALYNGVAGTLGLVNTLNSKFDLTSGDLANSAGEYYQDFNGVLAKLMGGIDILGAKNYLEGWKKRTTWDAITKGAQTGSVFSVFNPIAGIAGLIGGGAIGGLLSMRARRNAEREFAEAQRTYAKVSDAFNTQEASTAATKGLLNEFNITHADEGLSVNTKNPNALVQGGEPIVKVDGSGNIISASMFPITPQTPERVDNIPVRLDQGSSKHGVLGNKIDPFTGERLAVEGRPLVAAINDPSIKNKQPYKQALKNLFEIQDLIPSYNMGKTLKRYAGGKSIFNGAFEGAEIPLTAFFVNHANNLINKEKINRMPPKSYDAYAPNEYVMLAGAMMPTAYNIDPLMQALNDESRYVNYAINQSSYSPGQKMALLSSHWNKRMKAITDLLGEKHNQENTMRANYAKWLSDVGAQSQQLISAYRLKYYEGLAQANVRKFTSQQQNLADTTKNFDDLAANLLNLVNANKNIGLYQQELTNEEKRYLASNGYGTWNPTFAFTPYKIKSPLDKKEK